MGGLSGVELKIVYKNNQAYGIRDKGGFLFFFADITRFTGQEERYDEEINQQLKLATYLLEVLGGAAPVA